MVDFLCRPGHVGSWPLPAEEPAVAFLNALRENRYFDEALAYLITCNPTRKRRAELLQELAYQRGATLIQAVATDRDRAVREERLNQAKASLEAFMRDQPTHAKRSFARHWLGVVLREWARMKMEQVKRADNPALRQEAASYTIRRIRYSTLRRTNCGNNWQRSETPLRRGVKSRENPRSSSSRCGSEFLDTLLRRGAKCWRRRPKLTSQLAGAEDYCSGGHGPVRRHVHEISTIDWRRLQARAEPGPNAAQAR